jgi:hypothetical protein
VPALVLGPAEGYRPRHLGLRLAEFPVLGREQEATVHAERLGVRPAEEVAGARVPARHAPVVVLGDDRVVRGALDDRPGHGRVRASDLEFLPQPGDLVARVARRVW